LSTCYRPSASREATLRWDRVPSLCNTLAALLPAAAVAGAAVARSFLECRFLGKGRMKRSDL